MGAIRQLARDVAVTSFIAVWCVVLITIAMPVALVSRERALAMARWFWAPPILRVIGARVEVLPGAPLDVSRPHIFVLNHQSMSDVPLAFAHLPANLRFIAKHSLRRVPFIGWFMVLTGMVFVNRSNHVQAVRSLDRAAEQLRTGASILAFPEGTRSRDGRILPFKKGVFRLAIAAGTPIVPVAIDGTGRLLSPDAFHFIPSPVRIRVGAPIETKGLRDTDCEALLRRVRDAMIDLHVSIGGAGGDRDQPTAARRLPGGEDRAA